jgi:hypothetical protein
MTDDQYRGLLTEREILIGDLDVSDSYQHGVVSRVRSKISRSHQDLFIFSGGVCICAFDAS